MRPEAHQVTKLVSPRHSVDDTGAVLGQAAVSFDAACNEVRVRSDWGSRAVDQILGAVASGLAEDGIRSATLAIGDAVYTVVTP